MTEGIKSKILNPWFTTKEMIQGTGLELAIAREIITEKHGEAIEVNAPAGQGSEFVLKLPCP
jgi:signal transduction histidine kinase